MAQIIWYTNDLELVIQFRGIGEYAYFKAVLGQFKAISKPRWSRDELSWKLPVEDFPKLVRFADSQKIQLVWVGYEAQSENLLPL